jgi:hypothetical protein
VRCETGPNRNHSDEFRVVGTTEACVTFPQEGEDIISIRGYRIGSISCIAEQLRMILERKMLPHTFYVRLRFRIDGSLSSAPWRSSFILFLLRGVYAGLLSDNRVRT